MWQADTHSHLAVKTWKTNGLSKKIEDFPVALLNLHWLSTACGPCSDFSPQPQEKEKEDSKTVSSKPEEEWNRHITSKIPTEGKKPTASIKSSCWNWPTHQPETAITCCVCKPSSENLCKQWVCPNGDFSNSIYAKKKKSQIIQIPGKVQSKGEEKNYFCS